jgi:hypothetical protein
VQLLTIFNESAQHWGRPLDPYGDGADVLAAIYEYFVNSKIAHASFLLDPMSEEYNLESRW